ncbi:hypothetical protein FISHEDRAFT_33860 [Fistulina hepatica ATCC 64428]|uniref:Uncharacterized protein n=1 Tax=Fistulina hepatica ATCC 64428 TaxID=1128425 RepID=A0A0D7ANB8_9AGAR|nr:hypothetical protein FISHEDRAFT_33860 [Fistulina hepatica ATCC 64428]
MGPSVQLDVDNTSPTINYFPSTDVLSNTNISRGWVPFYSQSGYASTIGEVGVGQSYHITSRVGASLIIEWHGTAIQLLGNATNISYSVTLDGQVVIDGDATRSSDILATFGNLTDSSHLVNLTITDTRSGSQLAFDKASITSHVSSGYTVV